MLFSFYLLVIAHFLADFVFQGPLADGKRGANVKMVLHGLVVSIAFFLPLINYPAGKVILSVVVYFVSHIIVDAARVEINKLLKIDPGKYLFWAILGFDQIAHVSVAYLIITNLLV